MKKSVHVLPEEESYNDLPLLDRESHPHCLLAGTSEHQGVPLRKLPITEHEATPILSPLTIMVVGELAEGIIPSFGLTLKGKPCHLPPLSSAS